MDTESNRSQEQDNDEVSHSQVGRVTEIGLGDSPMVFAGSPPEPCGDHPWDDWSEGDSSVGGAGWLVLERQPDLAELTDQDRSAAPFVDLDDLGMAPGDRAVRANFGDRGQVETLVLGDEYARYVKRAFGEGADLVVIGYLRGPEGNGYAVARWPFAVRGDEVDFRRTAIGSDFRCHMITDFDDVAKRIGLEAEGRPGFIALVEAMLANDQTVIDVMTVGGALFREEISLAQQSWLELPADERTLDLSDPLIPQRVKDQLEPAGLALVVPPGLRKDSLALCSRTRLGLGPDCHRLSGVTDGGAALLPLLKLKDPAAAGVEILIAPVDSRGAPEFDKALVLGQLDQSLLAEANENGGGVVGGLAEPLRSAKSLDELRRLSRGLEGDMLEAAVPAAPSR